MAFLKFQKDKGYRNGQWKMPHLLPVCKVVSAVYMGMAAGVTAFAAGTGAVANMPVAAVSADKTVTAAVTDKTVTDKVTADKASEGKASAERAAWPADTALHYTVAGHYRGRLSGTAVLRFARRGGGYSSELHMRLGLHTIRMHSSGVLSAQQLHPRQYTENIRGEQRRVVNNGRRIRFFVQDVKAPTPAGVLDTLSQFWAMQRNVQQGRWKLNRGNGYRVWLMRPEGLFLWSYTVAGQEAVTTAGGARLMAYRIKPVALGRGTASSDIWLAPDMDYLPVRIRLRLEGGGYVDMRLKQG